MPTRIIAPRHPKFHDAPPTKLPRVDVLDINRAWRERRRDRALNEEYGFRPIEPPEPESLRRKLEEIIRGSRPTDVAGMNAFGDANPIVRESPEDRSGIARVLTGEDRPGVISRDLYGRPKGSIGRAPVPLPEFGAPDPGPLEALQRIIPEIAPRRGSDPRRPAIEALPRVIEEPRPGPYDFAPQKDEFGVAELRGVGGVPQDFPRRAVGGEAPIPDLTDAAKDRLAKLSKKRNLQLQETSLTKKQQRERRQAQASEEIQILGQRFGEPDYAAVAESQPQFVEGQFQGEPVRVAKPYDRNDPKLNAARSAVRKQVEMRASPESQGLTTAELAKVPTPPADPITGERQPTEAWLTATRSVVAKDKQKKMTFAGPANVGLITKELELLGQQIAKLARMVRLAKGDKKRQLAMKLSEAEAKFEQLSERLQQVGYRPPTDSPEGQVLAGLDPARATEAAELMDAFARKLTADEFAALRAELTTPKPRIDWETISRRLKPQEFQALTDELEASGITAYLDERGRLGSAFQKLPVEKQQRLLSHINGVLAKYQSKLKVSASPEEQLQILRDLASLKGVTAVKKLIVDLGPEADARLMLKQGHATESLNTEDSSQGAVYGTVPGERIPNFEYNPRSGVQVREPDAKFKWVKQVRQVWDPKTPKFIDQVDESPKTVLPAAKFSPFAITSPEANKRLVDPFNVKSPETVLWAGPDGKIRPVEIVAVNTGEKIETKTLQQSGNPWTPRVIRHVTIDPRTMEPHVNPITGKVAVEGKFEDQPPPSVGGSYGQDVVIDQRQNPRWAQAQTGVTQASLRANDPEPDTGHRLVPNLFGEPGEVLYKIRTQDGRETVVPESQLGTVADPPKPRAQRDVRENVSQKPDILIHKIVGDSVSYWSIDPRTGRKRHADPKFMTLAKAKSKGIVPRSYQPTEAAGQAQEIEIPRSFQDSGASPGDVLQTTKGYLAKGDSRSYPRDSVVRVKFAGDHLPARVERQVDSVLEFHPANASELDWKKAAEHIGTTVDRLKATVAEEEAYHRGADSLKQKIRALDGAPISQIDPKSLKNPRLRWYVKDLQRKLARDKTGNVEDTFQASAAMNVLTHDPVSKFVAQHRAMIADYAKRKDMSAKDAEAYVRTLVDLGRWETLRRLSTGKLATVPEVRRWFQPFEYRKVWTLVKFKEGGDLTPPLRAGAPPEGLLPEQIGSLPATRIGPSGFTREELLQRAAQRVVQPPEVKGYGGFFRLKRPGEFEGGVEAPPPAPSQTGINIVSPYRGRQTDDLGAALTNVTFRKYPVTVVEGLKKPTTGQSAEHWYQANKATSGTPAERLAADRATMQKIIVAKLLQYPELVQQITQRGGRQFLEASRHIVGVPGSRWEGNGLQSNFIRTLADAYDQVIRKNTDWSTGGAGKLALVGALAAAGSALFPKESEAAPRVMASGALPPNIAKLVQAARAPIETPQTQPATTRFTTNYLDKLGLPKDTMEAMAAQGNTAAQQGRYMLQTIPTGGMGHMRARTEEVLQEMKNLTPPQREALDGLLLVDQMRRTLTDTTDKIARLRAESIAALANGEPGYAQKLSDEATFLEAQHRNRQLVPGGEDEASLNQTAADLEANLRQTFGDYGFDYLDRVRRMMYGVTDAYRNELGTDRILSPAQIAAYGGRSGYIPRHYLQDPYDPIRGVITKARGLIKNVALQNAQATGRATVPNEKLIQTLKGLDDGQEAYYKSPSENFLQFAADASREIQRNRMARKFFEAGQASANPQAWRKLSDPTQIGPDEGVLAFQLDGETVYYAAPKDFADAVTIADAQHLDTGLNVANGFMRLFKGSVASANPLYGIGANLFRDIPFALWGPEYNKYRSMGLGDYWFWGQAWLRSVRESWNGEVTQGLKDAFEAGVYMDELSQMYNPRNDALGRGMLTRAREDWGQGATTLKPLAWMGDALQDAANWSTHKFLDPFERATKRATFETLQRVGYTDPAEAAFQARLYGGSPDFAQKGLKADAIGKFIVFFNPKVQSTKRLVHIARTNPEKIAWFIGSLTAGFLALQEWNDQFTNPDTGNKEWDEVPEIDRSKNLVIVTPFMEQLQNGQRRHVTIKLPMTEEFQVMAGPVLAAIRALRKDQTFKPAQTAADFAMNFLPVGAKVDLDKPMDTAVRSVVASTNPMLRVPFELKSDQVAYTGAPIFGSRMEELSPELQQRVNSSRLGTFMAKKFGTSPILTDYLTKGLVPGLGEAVSSGIGQLVPDYRPATPQSPTDKAYNMPIIGSLTRRFMATPLIQSERHMLDQLAAAEKITKRAAADLGYLQNTTPEELTRMDPKKLDRLVQLAELNKMVTGLRSEVQALDRQRDVILRSNQPVSGKATALRELAQARIELLKGISSGPLTELQPILNPR